MAAEKIIRKIMDGINSCGINYLDSVGISKNSLSDDVVQYDSTVKGIKSFSIYNRGRTHKEIEFIGDGYIFDYLSIKKEFGKLDSFYNWRDDYTEFVFGYPTYRLYEFFLREYAEYHIEDGELCGANNIQFNMFLVRACIERK